MMTRASSYQWRASLASTLLACACLFSPVRNAEAVANLNLSTSFTSADPARSSSYMDAGGTWNGTTEVSNTTGDSFVLTVNNDLGGIGVPATDSAFDIAISIDVRNGFRLPTSPYSVTVTETPAAPGCPVLVGITATQAGGAGTPITVNIPADTDILPDCSYDFEVGLTTHNVPPSVAAGIYPVNFNVSYNEIDNTAASSQSSGISRNVAVRRGDVALLKTAVTPIAGDGDTVEFTVSILGAGQGGIFNVVLTDVISTDLAGLIINAPVAPPGAPGPAANQYTFEYIAPGQQVNVSVFATVAVDPIALSCPDLRNDADVVERLGTTSSFFDAVPFDLQEPILIFTAPVVNVPLNGGPTSYSINLNNAGSGTARQVSLQAAGTVDLDSFNVTVTSPGWAFDSITDTFSFAGTIPSTATETLTFTVETTSCPPPAGGNLNWDLSYQNVCGTAFNPAIQSANLNTTNVPNATIGKTVSVGALNVGEAGSYTLTTGGTNLVALPENDADDTNNNDFSVSDTFPPGIQNIEIPAIPAGTEVEVLGIGIFTGSVPLGQIPPSGTIIWRGDAVDLQATPNLQINFEGGGVGVCPTGQTVTNNTTLISNCAINDIGAAGFILNESPAGGATLNINVGGDGQFETGAADTNNINRDENREGEHIPFNVTYSFPPGYEAGVIPWTDLAFNAELRTLAGAGEPLVLTNNRNSVLLTVTSGGLPTACTQIPLSPGVNFTGGEGINPLDIATFGFVPATCGIGNFVDDVSIVLEYSATSAEGTLAGPNPYTDDPIDQANVGAYIENTRLSITGSTPGCTGTTDFVQGVTVDLIRSDLGLTGSIGSGSVAVCEVVPVSINLNELNADTTADDVLLNLGLTDLQIVNGASTPSANVNADITRTGGLSAFALTSPPGNNAGPVIYELQPPTTNLSSGGILSFNARVLDVGVAFNATVSFDSKHTSPDAGGDADRDFASLLNVAPTNIRSADLDLEFFPKALILRDQVNYSFRAHIVNTGDGDAAGGIFQITLPPEMNYVGSSSIPAGVVGVPAGSTITWDLSASALGDLGTGEAIDIDINVQITQNSCFQSGIPALDNIDSQTTWGCGVDDTETLLDTPPIVLPSTQLTLTHDLNNSFCELCNLGEVHLFVRNTGGVLDTDIAITEDLLASGLEYVPLSTSCIADEGVCTVLGEPTILGTQITWDKNDIDVLSNLYSAFSVAPNTPQEVEIIFQVRRIPAGTEEGLISAVRDIQATGQYGLFCDQFSATPVRLNALSQTVELPIQQPVPQVSIQGRNVDAGTTAADYADNVFGGAADDIIWRMTVANNNSQARADLEDLLMNNDYTFLSQTTPGAALPNFNISLICKDETDAAAAAGGATPADCIAPPGTPTSTSHDVDDPFGNPGTDEVTSFIDTLEGGQAQIYFVGTFQTLCNRTTNDVDIAWGCEVDAPAGGITAAATNNGIAPLVTITDSQISSTDVDPSGVLISQTVTGRNTAQPLGSAGVVTVTIRNNSGGTVRNITLSDALPAGYALDQTLQTAVVTPAFGVYTGMIDTITLTNPQALDENNTSPAFSLTSSGGAFPQDHLLRHGDVLVITLGVVKVTNFDIVADPEVRTETAPATDPTVTTSLSNQLSVVFENTCGFAFPAVANNLPGIDPDPEDLDVNINPLSPDLIYILSDPTASLALDVQVTNNGGHDAANFFTLVTTGSGLVVTPPPGCVSLGIPPPPRAVWLPALPPTATVYRCTTSNPIIPTATDSFIFSVQKNTLTGGADLTFRADVVGEITQSDGTPLTFPSPAIVPIINTANNYSLDSIRARLIGFNLTKVIQGNCTENNPAPINNNRVHIGEDCTFRMEAGWFGFATPGFGGIVIQNALVTDTIPNGQGYISDNTTNSTANILNITTLPAVLNPLVETSITWSFDPFITDETFSVDLVTRTLNDPINASLAPNLHPVNRTDTLNATFEVDFGGTVFSFNSTTPGYPPVNLRRRSVRVIEPNLIITKEVCNESINGIGPACTTFLPLVNDGDTNDDYIYRITITNEASSGGFARAPAYDVDITDVLDPSDLLTLADFTTDGLDNDGDGLPVDEGDEAFITILPDNLPGGGLPGRGTVTILSANSTALQKIDPGASVFLYYRANPADAVAPGQQLLNSVTTTYDTLPGVSGNQNLPQELSGTFGGARVYNTAAQTATIEITALIAPPDSKGILNLSHTALGGAAPFVGPQDVVVGEEIEYQLQVEMPVSNLNNFVIRDELPPGIRCIEAQTIDLNAPPYNSAGFVWNGNPPDPGPGPFVPTCTDNLVEWNFGNQQLTTGPTFNFTATFIARVENTAITNEAALIRNGGTGAGSTQVTLSYSDAGGFPVVINLGPSDITVREPLIALDKSYAVLNADADDVITVTVTATNNGNAPAYNLRILDDLDAVANLTYLGNLTGADPPDVVDTATLGVNRPIFNWNPANPIFPINPTDSVSFSFEIQASSLVQPLEVLDNTIQASWTSLPDFNTALNAGGTIGGDGTATGMRIGAIPNLGDTLNDYESTFTNNNLSVLPVDIVKNDLNPAAVPTIGERKNFELVISIPEGVTNNLVITDDLFAASGLPANAAYVLENNVGFDITYTFSGIATINGAAPDEVVFTAFPADGATGNVVWSIGNVVTNTENDAVASGITPLIRINYFARINNDINTDENDAMLNSATADFTNGEVGGTATSGPVAAPQVTVLEPLLSATKTFTNVTPGKLATDLPDGGDSIEYVVIITNSGSSTAFDTNIVDTLPAALQFDAGFTATATVGGVDVPLFNPIPAGVPGGPLIWGRGNADDTLDIQVGAGQALVLTYRVILQDTVLADLAINNSVVIDWTSLDGVSADERTGGAVCPVIIAPNDYCTGPVFAALNTSDNNTVLKTRLTDTFVAGDADVRIGDIIDYELRLTIQEGTSPAVVVSDVLPQGLAFESVISINGDSAAPYAAIAPFTYPDILATGIAVAGNPITGPSTVTWTLGNIINAADNNTANDEFVLVYRARVLNLVHPQVNNINLTNTANLDYTTAVGAAVTKTDNEVVALLQPNLAVAKTALPAGGDAIIDASELIDYTVDITNNGTAPAYDTVLRDIIPVGLRNGGATITVISTQLVVAATVLPNIAPIYSAVTGIAAWDFDSGVADQYNIPPGDTLRLVYRVQAEPDIGAGLTMINSAQVQLYYSFDDDAVPVVGASTGVREIYGPSNIATSTLLTPAANPLDKQNPTNLNASIGEPFTYRITIPDVVQTTAIHDVRILDDIGVAVSGADLEFVSVTRIAGSLPWTPTNVGTPTNLIIQDSGLDGIDIPAGQQVIIDLTVQLRDQPVNTATPPLLFNNTASYTFNMVDDDNGTQGVTAPVTTGNMTVVEPTDMTMIKSGPATILFGTPEVFTLDVQNIGTGPAWDLTITDVLPNPTPGGMCDTPPNNFTAQIVPLVGPVRVLDILAGDYVANFAGDPVCTLSVTMQTAAARLDAGDHLIVTYEATLDVDNIDAAALTNIAGATEWFSADTAGAGAVGQIRTYTRLLTDGTPLLLDHQDDHTVLTQSPILVIQKNVLNVTSGQDPGFNAEPGDTLRYTITINNSGIVDANNVVVTDAVPPNTAYVADSVTLNGLPVGVPDGGVSPLVAGIDANSPAAGVGIVEVGQTATITFDVLIDPVLGSGTIIRNQALVDVPNFSTLFSDDPNINGVDDPLVFGDEDPTDTLVGSVPTFRLQKTSQDLTGDPNVLAQGDTLRYIIIAKNIGVENAVNSFLRDQVPANTSYVANSTTLNGIARVDSATGVSPLQDGFLINAPEDSTPGNMRADGSGTTTNIATITFDVVVASDIVNGTIISNQGFVTGEGVGSGLFPTQQSDDPATDILGDPTQDIIGNLPILDVQKTVSLLNDVLGDGVVDNGDSLRYTFNISNAGSIPATGVVLRDNVPTNASYIANSVIVDGIAIADTVPGTSPLIAGIDISSSDLTPPLPTPGNGQMNAGRSTIVTFDVLVTAATGLVTNQAMLSSNEFPDEPSDADGNDENGDQPTVIAIGNAQQVVITKEVQVVGGSVARAGGQLEYIIRVENVGSEDVTNLIITDNLAPVAAQIIYVTDSGRMNGSTNGVNFAGSLLTADFGTTYGVLEAGISVTLSFVVDVNAGLADGTMINNTADVSWNAATQNASDSANVDIGSAPGIAVLNGTVWHDANFDNTLDGNERLLENWNVEIYLNARLLDNVFTDANGQYRIIGLTPSSLAGGEYELRYVAPGAGGRSALLGEADSASSAVPFTDSLQQISNISVGAGSNSFNLNLPIDPNGVVYDSILRTPVEGVTLTMLNAGLPVPASCFDDPAQQNQVTLADGFYKFDLNFSVVGNCDVGDSYVIQVTPPPTGYVGTTSVIIPPALALTDPPFSVPTCPGSADDQLSTVPDRCEIQGSEFAPATSIAPRTAGTNYYLQYTLGNSASPFTSQIFNNHIPVDPELDAAIAISKTSSLLNVTRSQLVPYTITLNNTLAAPLQDLDIVDNFPPGFKYVAGSARIDGVSTEPTIVGLILTWPNLTLNSSEVRTIKMLLVVGSGVGEGEYINLAQAINNRNGEAASEQASATVRVVPDPTFDCSDIIGKVFDDKNLNGYQDEGEAGLPSAKVVTARGIEAKTDEFGRFHITCAVVPNEDRGSNFIMKLDERSLPSGYRITTENPRVLRATRGKMLKFNFGAAIHRVVRLDMADAVFEPNSTEMRPQWLSRVALLLEKLVEAPSVLRLAYMGDVENASLAEDRLQTTKNEIERRWAELNCCYRLEIETEIFWRTGKPADEEVFK